MVQTVRTLDPGSYDVKVHQDGYYDVNRVVVLLPGDDKVETIQSLVLNEHTTPALDGLSGLMDKLKSLLPVIGIGIAGVFALVIILAILRR